MNEAYNKAWKQFMDEMGDNVPSVEVEFSTAWKACKDQVLKILNVPIQNADLSHETCDSRFIEKISKL